MNLPPASSVMLLGLPDSFHQDFCVFVFVIVGSLSAFACRFMQIYFHPRMSCLSRFANLIIRFVQYSVFKVHGVITSC